MCRAYCTQTQPLSGHTEVTYVHLSSCVILVTYVHLSSCVILVTYVHLSSCVILVTYVHLSSCVILVTYDVCIIVHNYFCSGMLSRVPSHRDCLLSCSLVILCHTCSSPFVMLTCHLVSCSLIIPRHVHLASCVMLVRHPVSLLLSLCHACSLSEPRGQYGDERPRCV